MYIRMHPSSMLCSAALLFASANIHAQDQPAATRAKAEKHMQLKPKMDRDPQSTFKFDGLVGSTIDALTQKWLLVAVQNNPRMLDEIRNRNQQPFRTLEPWAGEFSGKHLTSSAEIYRITRDPALKAKTDELVDQLAALQAENGYLGVFPDANQMTGMQPDEKTVTCDAWAHYHIMLGMILWHRETGNSQALQVARKIGDLMCEKFLNQPGKLFEMGTREYNFAPVHSLALLFEDTGESRYRELATQIIEKEYRTGVGTQGELARGMDFVDRALEGQEFFDNKFPAGPRWECLHTLIGVGEMAWVTGNSDYARAVEHIWRSMDKTDRHNHGGWGSMEQAFGNPYEVRPKELCCGVAWMGLGVEALRITADSVVADELELTFLNFTQAYQARSGEWMAYNVPVDGRVTPAMPMLDPKRPPNSDVCCCTVNGPRGFGLLTEWALQVQDQGLVLNYYGPSTLTAHAGDIRVEIAQQTAYPRTGDIRIQVTPERSAHFALKLRIPHWSRATTARVNGEAIESIQAGSYLTLDRVWKAGDIIELHLDMQLHYWVGDKEAAGRAAFYHGPTLLALNRKRPETYLQYTGEWRSMITARHLPYVDLYGSNKPGDSVAYDFEGTSVAWTYNRFENCGTAEIKIDGEKVDTVDLYDPINFDSLFVYEWNKPNLFLSARWEKTGLAPGKHRLEITVLPEKNEKSQDHWINVREFITETGDPVFDVNTLNPRLAEANPENFPVVAIAVTDTQGRTYTLCDFDSATENSDPFISWIKVINATPTPYSERNPTRSTYPLQVAANRASE